MNNHQDDNQVWTAARRIGPPFIFFSLIMYFITPTIGFTVSGSLLIAMSLWSAIDWRDGRDEWAWRFKAVSLSLFVAGVTLIVLRLLFWGSPLPP